MKKKIIPLWLCLFVFLLAGSAARAQTWTLFNNAELDDSVTDFQSENPSLVTPWSYSYFNTSTSVYTRMGVFSTSEKIGNYAAPVNRWCSAAGDWLYIAATGEVHMKSQTERPAICFTAPADGYYKADVSIQRVNYGAYGANKAQVYAYFNYVKGAAAASMEFDLPVSIDAMNAEGTYFTAKDQVMYVYMEQGDIITFETGTASSTNGNGNTQWSKLEVSATDEGTATNADKYFTASTKATQTEVAALAALVQPARDLQKYLEYHGLTATGEAGKFNQADYDLLGSYITQAEEIAAQDPITASAVEVTALSVNLSENSLLAFKGKYNWPALTVNTLQQGWYRLRAKENNCYFSEGKFADAKLKYDGSQYFYLRCNSDVNSRYELYSFDGLKVGTDTKVGSYGSTNHFQIHDFGSLGLLMRSGGNGTRWSGLNEDGSPKTSNAPFYLDDGTLLFFTLIPLSADECAVESIPDGTYTLSFNGTSKGDYPVVDGKLVDTEHEMEYPVLSYRDRAYSIGDELVATMKSDLSSYPFNTNKGTPNNAVPYPGFRLTPVIDGDEVQVATLTNFATGELAGKTVKVAGTVDFANLETAGAAGLEIVDYQPFHAYTTSSVATLISYTRDFNVNAEGEFSTAEAPRWETICLPFEVEAVKGACPVVYEGDAGSWDGSARTLSADKDYWLYELTATGFVRNTTVIEANKPYIIAFPYSWTGENAAGSYEPQFNVSGAVTFEGSAIVATEEEKAQGEEYYMVANFKNVEAGEEIYVLDANGAFFEKGVAAAVPFRPYAVWTGLETAPDRIDLDIEADAPTGLAEVPSVTESVQVVSAEGGVHVTSGKAHTVTIYTVGGAVLGRVNVQPGTQFITLPVGTFVVNGVKVIITH